MADQRSTRMKIADALQGFGAGVAGDLQPLIASRENQRRLLDEERSQAVLEDAFTIQRQLQAGDVPGAQNTALARFDAIRQLNGDPSHTLALLNKLDAGDIEGALNDVTSVVDFGIATKRLRDPSDLVPADTQAFEGLIAGFTDEEKQKARRVKAGLAPRAVGSAGQTITVEGIAGAVAGTLQTLAEGKETGTLTAQRKLKPGVQAAVTTAVKGAEALADQALLDRTNAGTFDVYETGMRGLVTGMDNTLTGPFIAMLPAVTANAQIADGAVAAMAPVLKQMFRAAGEGIFTDKDQELLLEMVPSRSDFPEARQAKLVNIDAIVRAKLGIQLPVPGGDADDPRNLPGFDQLPPKDQQELLSRAGFQ